MLPARCVFGPHRSSMEQVQAIRGIQVIADWVLLKDNSKISPRASSVAVFSTKKSPVTFERCDWRLKLRLRQHQFHYRCLQLIILENTIAT